MNKQSLPGSALLLLLFFFFYLFKLYSTITRNTLAINNMTIKTNYCYTRSANSERASKLRKVLCCCSGVLMLLCVSQQDDSSPEHDDEEASERVSLLLYAHFVSFIVQL